MNTAVKVAIIGAGIGAEHLDAYLQLPDKFSVHTLCDTDTERATSVIGDNTSITVEENFDTVLDNPDIDLIDICLPPHLHFSASSAALRAGKNVVCEKPLVSSLRDADALAQLAAETGRLLTPVFQYRYGPAMSKLRALIDAGLTGKPLVASVETHWNRGSDYYNNDWRGTWKGEQGGAVLGHAIHNHDFLCAIFGPVNMLHAFCTTRVNDIEVEDCASVSFEMRSGALATSSITLGASSDITRIQFCFENLTAVSDSLPYAPADGNWTFSARNTISQAELDRFLDNVPTGHSGFTGFFDALATKLASGDGEAVSVADGRRSLELVTAIYDSARSGKRVQLPLTQTHSLYNGWGP